MNNTRPTTIKVGVFTYDVTYDTGALAVIGMEKRAGLVGYTNHQTQQIILREDLAEDQIRDTLLHEILHIIWVVTGMHERESMTQEETVAGISPNFLGVLRENQDLVSYLLSE